MARFLLMDEDGDPALGKWDSDRRLRDGTIVHVRAIRPDDADRHRAFMACLSKETVYFRFFGPHAHLSDDEVEHFCTVDYTNRMAFVVTIDDAIIAIARYDRLDGGDAEVAFVVADEYQGRGIATILLELLADEARCHEIPRLVAEVLSTNQRMIRVFDDAGYPMEQHLASDGVVYVTLDLTGSTN